jgi:hypothetical protein
MKNKIVHHSIISIFVSLYLLVATISMINSVDFFNLSHSGVLSWSLAIGFELGAAASLAAIIILDKTNKFMVWGLFLLLTCFQMMANSYHAYSHLTDYQAWIELFGLTDEEPIAQKRILSIVSGAVLPLVALGFIKSLTDYIKPEVTPTMLHPDNELPKQVTEETPVDIRGHQLVNQDTGEINLPHEELPISQEIYFPNSIEEEETPNSIQDEDIYETQAADAVSVEDEQPQDRSLIDEILEESDNLASPHKRTGEFVSKPKNWGMRFPPIKL